MFCLIIQQSLPEVVACWQAVRTIGCETGGKLGAGNQTKAFSSWNGGGWLLFPARETLRTISGLQCQCGKSKSRI